MVLRKTGFVVRMAVLLGAVLPRMVAAAPPEASPNSSTPDNVKKTEEKPLNPTIIPLYLSENRMLVMLRIGDYPPVPVVFDTGTNGNLLDLELADRLKLPNTGPSPSIDGSTGKPVPGHDTFITKASLGGFAIADARATAFAYNLPDEVGIFGPNSFPGKLVRVDGPRSRLVLLEKRTDTVPGSVSFPYLGENGDALPSAVVECGDLKITAILDSGNNSSLILPMEYVSKLSLDAPPKQIGYAVSAAGKQPIYSAHLKGSLKIGEARLEQPEVRFMEGGRPNVGLPLLRQLIVVLDPDQKRTWVLPAGAPLRQGATQGK